MSRKWDAVIIGSGIGGLTCGAFLAKAGMRVRVLEKHYRIGGYAHSFKRGQYRFESGIHSAPMESNGYIRLLLRTLGIENKIETIPHNIMYTSGIGDSRWTMPATEEEIKQQLFSSFPGEKNNIEALFSDLESLYNSVVGPLLELGEKGSDTNPSILKKYQEHTYETYLASFIKDQRLRDIFYSQWPFCGLTPECTSTAFFSLMYYVHVREGSNYLKGGFETLAQALASVITEHGGEVSINSPVKKVHAEQGIVKNVQLESGEDIEATHFISNVSPYHLMEELLDENSRNRLWIRRLHKLTCSSSAVALYLGLESDISDLLPQNILFWYPDADFKGIHNRIFDCKSPSIDHLVALKTPDASEAHTLFLMTYFNKGYTGDWSGEKEQIATQILDLAEKLIPGIKNRIQCQVSASPATFERYTGNSEGSLYGFANFSDWYNEARIPMATYIPNLYQTGHWCRGGGVWNVMESGYTTSKMVLKSR